MWWRLFKDSENAWRMKTFQLKQMPTTKIMLGWVRSFLNGEACLFKRLSASKHRMSAHMKLHIAAGFWNVLKMVHVNTLRLTLEDILNSIKCWNIESFNFLYIMIVIIFFSDYFALMYYEYCSNNFWKCWYPSRNLWLLCSISFSYTPETEMVLRYL